MMQTRRGLWRALMATIAVGSTLGLSACSGEFDPYGAAAGAVGTCEYTPRPDGDPDDAHTINFEVNDVGDEVFFETSYVGDTWEPERESITVERDADSLTIEGKGEVSIFGDQGDGDPRAHRATVEVTDEKVIGRFKDDDVSISAPLEELKAGSFTATLTYEDGDSMWEQPYRCELSQ